MDWTRIDEWARDELEAEAERLGIQGYEYLTRSELIGTLVKTRGGHASSVTQVLPHLRWRGLARLGSARSWVSEVLGQATRLLGGREATPSAGEHDMELPAPRAARPDDEPIRSRSMARLLAAQGHVERAADIYRWLLARQPDDDALRAELEALAPRISSPPDGMDGARATAPHGTLAATTDAAAGRADEDHIRVDEAQSAVEWRVSRAGRTRAEALLGQPGELSLRVVLIVADPKAVVRSVIKEHGPVAPAGRWQPEGLREAERCVAAVGLRADGRFVAIAHTRAGA